MRPSPPNCCPTPSFPLTGTHLFSLTPIAVGICLLIDMHHPITSVTSTPPFASSPLIYIANNNLALFPTAVPLMRRSRCRATTLICYTDVRLSQSNCPPTPRFPLTGTLSPSYSDWSWHLSPYPYALSLISSLSSTPSFAQFCLAVLPTTRTTDMSTITYQPGQCRSSSANTITLLALVSKPRIKLPPIFSPVSLHEEDTRARSLIAAILII